MPGSSLWLLPPKHHHHGPHVPHHLPHLPGHAHRQTHSRNPSHEIPKSHDLDTTLTNLITTTVPSVLPNESGPYPSFPPHVTLTSDIDLSTLHPSPEKWLERLAVPQVEEVKVVFKQVDVGSTFTKRLFIRCEKTGVEDLATLCRWQAVEGNKSGGMERAEEWAGGFDPHISLLYSGMEVSEEKRKEVEGLVWDSGISLTGEGDMSGWTGGTLWLVPTFRPIAEWEPIAERRLEADDNM